MRGIGLFDAKSPESRAFADCALRVFAPPRQWLQEVDLESGEAPVAKTKSAPAKKAETSASRAKGARK